MRRVFLGEFQHSIDRQRRTAIPREWRDSIDQPSVFYLMPGRDRSVQVMPRDFFMEEVYAKVKSISFADSGRLLSKIGRFGHESVCDKQGRISLSPQLVQHANLNLPGQVMFVGAVASFELRRVEDSDTNDRDIEHFLDELERIQRGKSEL